MSSDENSGKRTRASGEVLDFLLQEFEKNHNPTPDQRKEISERTGMAEKAVRIWFQNRRAKLRKVERMSSSSSIPVKKAPSHHSSRSNSFTHDAADPARTSASGPAAAQAAAIPIEVNDTYCFIDCTSLSVGSWQRIKSGFHDERALRSKFVNLSPFTLNNVMNSVDLLVILSKKNFEINYFFSAVLNNSKILFRIFYPISSIVTSSLLDNNIHKESNELRLSLAHQPKFSVYFFNGVNSNTNQWSICDDFSEGQQVSHAHFNEGGTSIPHVLVGVKNSLQYLNAFILENTHQQLQHHQQLHANPYSNPTPPLSAADPPKYHHHPIQLAEDHSSAGNFQFTNDDLNSIWDDAPSITPNRSHNHTPITQTFPGSTTASVSAHPPAKQVSSGLSGFSPLTNFDSAASPNSSTSGGSNFQKDIYMHLVQPASNGHSHHAPILHEQHHSISHTPRSVESNQNPVPADSSHKDTYEDMFHNANTPDFLTNLGEENEASRPKSNESNSDSPSVNSISTNNVHAYTHQHQNGHNPAYELLNGSDFHHHSDFDYNGGSDYPGLGEEASLNPLDNNSSTTNDQGNKGGNGSGTGTGTGGNVDSFIDFGI